MGEHFAALIICGQHRKRKDQMKHQVGLWIDHRESIIVTISGEGEATRRITSKMEKHVRFSGGAEQATPEDMRDRKFAGHLTQYYDEVIAAIRDAESIFIFGPGEAKGELEKRLKSDGLSERVVGTETVDKMTDHQIAAKVREHFQNSVRQ